MKMGQINILKRTLCKYFNVQFRFDLKPFRW